jgi:hypothetical protein
MVVRKSWRIISGGVAAAMAVGAGAAVAQDDDRLPRLQDVVTVDELSIRPTIISSDTEATTVTDADTPLSALSEPSPASEPSPISEPSPVSEPSPLSDS